MASQQQYSYTTTYKQAMAELITQLSEGTSVFEKDMLQKVNKEYRMLAALSIANFGRVPNSQLKIKTIKTSFTIINN